uniref:Uncharacterized protein n=1 Tax=Opuntia streptacantha TaxID=393608 RepID=A0A7C8YB09_OPUST
MVYFQEGFPFFPPIVFILGALVTLLKLGYKAEEIITILKSHPVSMKTFISVLFLDLAALYASHKPSMCDSHSSLDKIGFLLDALLGTVVLLAIDQFLGWLFFIVWTLLVIAMAYELYKHYKQFLGSLCASILQRLPMSHNMMALHSTGEVELQQSATHSPSDEVNDEEEEVAVVV